MASDTPANKPHQALHPQAGMNSGPTNKASAVPVGMYAPHTPSMPGSWEGSTRRRIKAGAGKATSKKPMPSMARSNSNAVTTLDTAFVNDPPTLADMEVMRAAHNALVLALRR